MFVNFSDSFFFSHIVNAFLLTYQLGTCCVYIVFISENIKSVVDAYDTEIHLEIYMLIILLPLILLNYIKNLKYLAPFSTGANFITLVSFGFILYYIIIDGPTFEDREPVGEVRYWPLFFGTVLFALEAIGVVSLSCITLNLIHCVTITFIQHNNLLQSTICH